MKKTRLISFLLIMAVVLLAGCKSTEGNVTMTMDEYLSSTEYDWFITGKTDYMIQGKMVSADTEVYNILEGTDYVAHPDGSDVVLKSGNDVLWVSKLSKVATTYTKADGSEVTADDFTPDVYIDLRTIPSPSSNFACYIPKNIQVIVETAWGDVLTANRPEVEHGEGDYLICRVGEDGKPDLSDVWIVNGVTFQTTYDNTNNVR